MQREDYLKGLQDAIRVVHGSESRHLTTSAVKSVFEGSTAWEGEIETFELLSHPKARKCHTWGFVENGQLKTTAVLELPPVDSPSSAVDVALAAKARK